MNYNAIIKEAADLISTQKETISSLQAEVERLKKEKEDIWQNYVDQSNQVILKEKKINNLKAEIERLKSSEGVRETLFTKEEVNDLHHKVHEHQEGRYDITGEDCTDIIAALCEHPLLSTPSPIKVEEEKKEECSHENTKLQNVRCTVCSDCGEIIETDV